MLKSHKTPTKKCKNNLKLRLKNVILTYSKRHSGFLFTLLDKALYGSFDRIDDEFFKIVNGK